MLMELNHNTKATIEKMKSVRRRRIELRRMKSLCPKTPVCGGDVCLKRRPLNGDDSDRLTSSEESVNQIGEKRLRIEELNLDGGERLRFGSISVIGRRREMEDAVAAEVGFLTRDSQRYDFFGVYDGHGGSRVAEACRHRLHKVVAKRVEDGGQEINWKEVMVASFEEMDEEVNKNGAVVEMMGSTATVAVVGEEAVVVANCGDSRAVISRRGVAVPLSADHKPERADELKRIEVCGGKVINWNGQRVLGVLATSRSIGDKYLKPFVISEPEVTVNVRTENDEFLIIASDGLWDVISNDLACQHTRSVLYGPSKRKNDSMGSGGDDECCASDAAAALAQLAMGRGSRDNVSVIVVDLKRSKQHSTLQIGQGCSLLAKYCNANADST